MQINAAKCCSKHYMSARLIRDQFLNYFIKDKNHSFVRSSPVVPYCDKSLAFVNAGMNQFKNVFLDKQRPMYPRVTNTQKCVRVGGKHNDLDVIGNDGYHHTFFEMLGNWSFNDYFKREACRYAYELLTGPYKIHPNRLYMTYFKGDEQMGLEPDYETLEIWRELGVPKERIIPFDKKDNFWEMGEIGPCGPCTEIHYDHIYAGSDTTRGRFVNQGRADLTELWNLVFIQYNRNRDGSITELPHRHIDTGMGLERLVAVLQDKSSNYDTDLFTPLFDTIQKSSQVTSYTGSYTSDLDRDYRIIADHARMVTACIADGMFPDHNHKLRRILRKIMLVSEKTFKNERLIYEIVPRVSEILGETFPEMQNLSQILKVVEHEFEIYKSLRRDVTKAIKFLPLDMLDLIENDLLDYPGFIVAYKNLVSVRDTWKCDENGRKIVPEEYAFKLYDTYGMDSDAIERLCNMEGLNWNRNAFRTTLKTMKARSKRGMDDSDIVQVFLGQDTVEDIAFRYGTQATNDTYKYNSSWNPVSNGYDVQKLSSKVLKIIQDTKNPKKFHVITDKSNFYYESGGQVSDKGTLTHGDAQFEVTQVTHDKDFTIHTGKFTSDITFSDGSVIEMTVDESHRTGTTRHHTATHLLNASARQFQLPTCQKSSVVYGDKFKLELSIYGPRLTPQDFSALESRVRDAIRSGLDVKTRVINEQQLLSTPDIVLVPGEIYPDTGLRLVQIGEMESKELCCGTHVQNTGHLIDFCIVNVKLTGRASYIFTGVVGERAQASHVFGKKLLTQAQEIKRVMNKDNVQEIERNISDMHETLKSCEESGQYVPYTIKQEILQILDEIEAKCRAVSKEALKEFVEIEMKSLMEARPIDRYPFIVHYLASSTLVESVPLQKVTKYITDRPILVISFTGNTVKARCCVPEKFQSDSFNAEKWLQEVSQVFESPISPQKGSSPNAICNMKEKRINVPSFQEKLEKALNNSTDFAEFYFHKKPRK